METSAILKRAPLSAYKARLVIDAIRNKPVNDAVNFLNFSQKNAAKIIKKVLNSAIANAEFNNGADIDSLFVTTAYVDEGITMKRVKPRAKGRADRIFKRTCHITIKVAEK